MGKTYLEKLANMGVTIVFMPKYDGGWSIRACRGRDQYSFEAYSDTDLDNIFWVIWEHYNECDFN